MTTPRTLPLETDHASAAAAMASQNEADRRAAELNAHARALNQAIARHPDDDGQDVKITPEKPKLAPERSIAHLRKVFEQADPKHWALLILYAQQEFASHARM